MEEDNRLFSVSNDIMVKVWDIHDQACLLTVRPKSHLIKGELAGRFLLCHTNLLFRNIRNPCEHHHNLLKPKYEKKNYIYIFLFITAIHYNPLSRSLAFATDHIALLRLKNK